MSIEFVSPYAVKKSKQAAVTEPEVSDVTEPEVSEPPRKRRASKKPVESPDDGS